MRSVIFLLRKIYCVVTEFGRFTSVDRLQNRICFCNILFVNVWYTELILCKILNGFHFLNKFSFKMCLKECVMCVRIWFPSYSLHQNRYKIINCNPSTDHLNNMNMHDDVNINNHDIIVNTGWSIASNYLNMITGRPTTKYAYD